MFENYIRCPSFGHEFRKKIDSSEKISQVSKYNFYSKVALLIMTMDVMSLIMLISYLHGTFFDLTLIFFIVATA